MIIGRGIVYDSDANTSGWQVGSDVDNDADDGNDNAGCGGTDCDNCDNWIAATVAPTVNKDNINLNKFTNKVSREKSNMNTWILLKCMIYSWKKNNNFQSRFHHSPNHFNIHKTYNFYTVIKAKNMADLNTIYSLNMSYLVPPTTDNWWWWWWRWWWWWWWWWQ